MKISSAFIRRYLRSTKGSELDRYELARRKIMIRLLTALLFLAALSGPAFALDNPGVVVESLVQSSASWDGTSLPAYPAGQPQLTILRIFIPPGTTLPLHKHPVINAGVLLSGVLTVVTEQDETLQLKAGDPIIEVVNKWHYGRNDGAETAVIIVFYVGTADLALTVKP
jgi:quercetin dioxygenase-like cupin family protein